MACRFKYKKINCPSEKNDLLHKSFKGAKMLDKIGEGINEGLQNAISSVIVSKQADWKKVVYQQLAV